MQRNAERKVRALKRRTIASQNAMENAPDEDTRQALESDYQATAVKLKASERQLKDFCKQTGRRNDTSRSQVNGFGRSVAQKAVHGAKKSLTSGDNGGIIRPELKRSKGRKRGDIKPISKERFDQLTIEAQKNGATIMRGGEEVESHLDNMGADASILGDVIFFREETCISEVLEETYHFIQNVAGMNDDKGEPLRTYLNEIDAKKHLLENATKYKIPRSETQLTKDQLEHYQEQLKEYLEENHE